MKPQHREVSPFLKLIRDFLLGRMHVTNNRYADTVSSRSVPPPEPTPDGSPQDLAKQQYYKRDPRGQVMPPVDVVLQKTKEQASKAENDAKAAKAATPAAGTTGAAPSAPAATAAPAAKPVPPSTSDLMAQNKPSQKEQTKKTAKNNRLPKPGKLHQWD